MLKSQADPVDIISAAFGKWYRPASQGNTVEMGEYGQCARGKKTNRIYRANPPVRKAKVSQRFPGRLEGLLKESLNGLPSRVNR